jgi:cytidyltransferase-like protein
VSKIKRVMVDMSATLIHHGHVRLLKKAAKFGEVVVGLSSDKDILKYKGYIPELNFLQRKEIISSIKYVSSVVKVNYHVNEKDLKKHNIDLLFHGSDNFNKIRKKKLKIFNRTPGVSSSLLRIKAWNNIKLIKKKFVS